MKFHKDDWIYIHGYYTSAGKKNEFISYDGVGMIKAKISNHLLLVDIGPRDVVVAYSDVAKNYGPNMPNNNDD